VHRSRATPSLFHNNRDTARASSANVLHNRSSTAPHCVHYEATRDVRLALIAYTTDLGCWHYEKARLEPVTCLPKERTFLDYHGLGQSKTLPNRASCPADT
jgi:hypothetical protein